MSAIWGAIHLSGGEIPKEYGETFSRAYHKCKIDREDSLRDGSVLLGCELQYIKPVSKEEKLPYASTDANYYFTADVYLDNRDELLKEAAFQTENTEKMPDGEILRRIFMVEGIAGLERVHGSYTFAFYDKMQGKAYVGTDHMSNRCVYYAVIDGILFFSTLMTPIISINRDKLHENREFLTDFLANPDKRVYLKTQVTVYREIKHVTCGTVLEFDANSLKELHYWDPVSKLVMNEGKTDDEYRKELRFYFDRAVSRSIQTDGEIGICLSGGLDSTSVACIAARQLAEKGKKLYAYTMVPLKDFKDGLEKDRVADESDVVRDTAKYLGNVVEHYCSQEQINCWDSIPEQMEIQEGPFKSIQNVALLFGLAGMAHNDGCKILLDGQLGNDTISYGDREAYCYELLTKGHWIKLWKELGTHSAFFRYNRKKTLIGLVRSVFQRDKIPPYKEFREGMLVREYSEQQYKKMMTRREARTRRQYMSYILDPVRFRQIGENDTRFSLYEGLMCKDPTRDVDFLEWCLALPTEQFQKNCTSRRLVYEYLSDVLPPLILNQRLPRGLQSADTFFRIKGRGEEIYNAMKKAFECENPIVDREKALEFLHKNKALLGSESPDLAQQSDYETLFYVYEICHLFLKFF